MGMNHTVVSKSRRRLLLLGVLSLLVTTLGGVALGVHQWQLEGRDRLLHTQATEAIAEENFQDAMGLLESYLQRHGNDVDALVAYAQVKMQVVDASNHHAESAIASLSRAVALAPGRVELAEQLVGLYLDQGEDEEAVRLATATLLGDGENIALCRLRAVALARLGRFGEAIGDTDLYIKHQPRDWDARILRLFLMHQRGDAVQNVVELTRQWQEQWPGDQAFEIFEGVAWRLYDHNTEAYERFKGAMQRPFKQASLVHILVRQLDSMGKYDAALAVLNQHVGQFEDMDLIRLKCERLLQAKQYQTLAQMKMPPEASLVVLRMVALIHLGRQDEALDALNHFPPHRSSYGESTSHQGWSKLAHALVQKTTPLALIAIGNEVLKERPQNAMLQDLVATQWLMLGEEELARASWHRAIRAAPAWVEPRVQLARSLLRGGRVAAAVKVARMAIETSPGDLDAAGVLIESLTQLPDLAAKTVARNLLQSLAGKLSPVAELKLQARLLDVDQVKQQVDSILQTPSDLMPEDLLALAQISWERHGNWHQSCLSQYEKQFGVTPRWASLKARILVQQGRVSQAHQLFEVGANRDWLLARAQFLSLAGDRQALATWKRLINRFPKDIAIQRAVLACEDSQIPQALKKQAVLHLQQQTGPRGMTWRLHQARLLLSQTVDNRRLAQAAGLLHEAIALTPRAAAPRMLLVRCLEYVASREGICEQLQAVLETYPGHREAKHYLQRLNASQGS